LKLKLLLAGLIIWSGVLTWVGWAEYERANSDEVTITTLASGLNEFQLRTSQDETVIRLTRVALKKEIGREHQAELILAKLIQVLSEPEPEAAPSSLTNSKATIQ
jgi:hypothetical protein